MLHACMDTHYQTSQSSHKRIKRQYNTSKGIINAEVPSFDLPYDVLDKIFSFLPIKQAIQMGSLSPRFKNSWLSTRKLHFDKDFGRSRGRADFVRIVDHTFSLLEGPIESFRLYFDAVGSENIVKEWIKNSIDKGVEELDLDFSQGLAPFKLSSEIVDIASITILKLCFCVLDLQPRLQGLSLLNTLVLKRVNVTARMIETVFYNCTLLEFLDLTRSYVIRYLKISAGNLKRFKVLKVGDCPNLDRIEIDAPTLRSLHYCGHVTIFRFLDVLQLNDVMLNFIPSRGFTKSFQVGNIAYDLLHANVLSTTGTFLEGLCSKVMERFREKQLCFLHLKEFQLFMQGATFCNVYDITSFLKNCPCLEKIFIDLNHFSFECGPYWELHHRILFDQQYLQPFKYLRFIKVKGFNFQKYELELVKFLLQKAMFLETLILVTPKSTRAKVYAPDVLLNYNKILCCWRTSPKAKITIFEHFNDTSLVFPKHSKIWF